MKADNDYDGCCLFFILTRKFYKRKFYNINLGTIISLVILIIVGIPLLGNAPSTLLTSVTEAIGEVIKAILRFI